MTIATFHFAAQASRLKYAIAPSASVTATGDSTIGIDGSVWTVVGAAGSETSDWVLSAQTKDSCVVTAPSGTNKACILQRLVTTTVNGRTSQIASTAKIFSGVETICPGETYESDQSAGWSPLINDVIVNGGLPSDETLSQPIVLDHNQSFDISGIGAAYLASLAIQHASSGHVDNTETTFFSRANSLASLTFADSFHVTMPDGSAFDFDQSQDLTVVCRRVAGVTVGTAYFSSPASRLGGQVMLAIIPTAASSTIELRCTKAMQFGSLTNVSLTGTMAVARTVTGIKSGNGTTRIILQCSGSFASSDVVSLVFGANHTLADLETRRIAAQTLACFWYSHPTELAGFTSYRDAQVDVSTTDGQWVAPNAPSSGLVDATLIGQVNPSRRPRAEANRYAGAAAIGCYGIPVQADQSTDTFLVSAGYTMPINDDPIMLICGFTDSTVLTGAMPTGLAANTVRYAVNVNSSARTFQLSATVGGAAINFTSNGNDLYILSRSLWGVTTVASLVTASTDTCWMATRANRITTTNPGAPYNRQSPISATSTWGWTVDKGAGADTCVVGANGLTGAGYLTDAGADTPCEEGAPMLVRRRHTAGTLYVKRDRLTESAGAACGDFTSLSSTITVGARQSDMGGATDSDTFMFCTTSAVQTAQMIEGVESFFTLQPWGRFLRHDLFDVPETHVAVVGRTARLYWNQLHESAGGISQYTYSCSGGGSTDANGWSFTPAGGDVGTRTITLTALLGGRPVATRTLTLHVLAASDTGTVNVLPIGDSWTDGFTLPQIMRARLVTDGLTVNLLGSRGGKAVTVSAATNLITYTAHGYTDNQPIDFLRALQAGSALPTAVGGDIAEGVTYYVEFVDANTFGIRRTIGGARIDLTSAGTGTVRTRSATERAEGRGGWKLADFWLSQHSTEGVSPFRDPSTGLWSWSYYVATHCGGVTPNVVVIQLGINGSLSGYNEDGSTYTVDHNDPDSVSHMVELQTKYLEQMTRSILEASPTTKVVCLNPSLQSSRQSDFRINVAAQPPSVVSQEAIARSVHNYNRVIIDRFGGRESEGIFVASGAVMDRTNDYTPTDAFHPPDYTKQGENLAANVRYARAA